jgi:hypothetical protein
MLVPMAEGQRFFHQYAFGFARQGTCADARHSNSGNIALLLSHSQVFDSPAFVSETLTQESAVEDRDDRCIYLPTRHMGTNL